MSYSEDREKKVKSTAEEAIASIPPDDKPALAASHGTLFSWLLGMDAAHRDPALLVSPASTAGLDVDPDKLFPEADVIGTPANDFRVAWQHMAQHQQDAVAQEIVKAYVRKNAKGAQLMTKNSENSFWDVTGFFADGKPTVVAAKVGNRPYQPIGFDDGTHYVATEGSKTLWFREFSFALMLDYPAPFKITKDELARKGRTGALTEREIAQMKFAIGCIEDEREQFRKTTDPEAIPTATQQLRDTINLARMNVPRLESRMNQMAQEHPELGVQLERADVEQLSRASIEFINMLLADDKVANQITETKLVAEPAKQESLQADVIARLRAVLTDDGVTDSEAAVAVVSMAKKAIPAIDSLVEKLDGDMPIHIAIRTILASLES